MRRPIYVVVCLVVILSVPALAVELYGCDDTSLYTVDTDTGIANYIGDLDPYVTGLLGGLELAEGVLYGLACTPGNALWTVDPYTAETTQIGSGLGVGLLFEGGLAFDGQDLWGLNLGVLDGPKYLIRIDREDGTATVAGRIGTGDHDINGLAFVDGELYGIDRVTNALWNINRTDPTQSHQVGSPFGGGIDLGVKGGMANEYCYADDSHMIFRVNFTTGAAQILSYTAVPFRSLALIDPSNVPSESSPLRIEMIGPNPTSLGTDIRFVLPHEGQLTLAIHDGTGRLVRSLAAGSWGRGSHSISWDGLDDRGRIVPGGIYFLQGVASGYRLYSKIVVVH